MRHLPLLVAATSGNAYSMALTVVLALNNAHQYCCHKVGVTEWMVQSGYSMRIISCIFVFLCMYHM